VFVWFIWAKDDGDMVLPITKDMAATITTAITALFSCRVFINMF
jgi:hypothetical protein